jgi:hypothetical protein
MTLNINPKRNIGCFTADFRDKKVAVGGKAFHAGFFFMNAQNEYDREAPDGGNSSPKGNWLIMSRLISVHQSMWNVQDGLLLGVLDEAEAAKLHEQIQYILNVIAKARPFRYLDLEAERERCDALFGAESVRRINVHLQEKAQHTLQTDRHPNHDEILRIAGEEKHLQDYVTALDFYNKIGYDMNAALDFGRGFIKRLSTLEKRDENHLIQLAMACMAEVPFGRWNNAYQTTLAPNVEYIALPKKPKGGNYVVGKRMTFTRFLDFLVADFFEGLHAGHYPQQCENCGRYYLKTNARHQKYCTGVDPNDPKHRTCQAVAAAKGREAKELAADHPIKYAYENRLKSIRTHVKRDKISEDDAARAAAVALERMQRALWDNVYANGDYKTEIKQPSIYAAAGVVPKQKGRAKK